MLELKNLTRTYQPKKGVPVQALKNINLTFDDKGMVFVLGKSGSGKSTLLNLIGGLDFADSGEIIIDGKSSKDFKERDYDSYRNTYIGFVFQEYNILNEFTVGENILLALELQSQKEDKQRLESILKEVDLEGYADRKPNELSGGQKQRVAIARAIIKDPKIIMADEPTGALDSETGKAIFDTLKKLSQDRLVIVVSHDRDFAEQYGDRIIELADGEVISDESKNIAQKETAIIIDKKEDKQELKRARLPYKRALAMGARTLRRKRFRLAVTIILCFLSFTAFGFADVIVAFDAQKSASATLYNENYVSFISTIADNNQDDIKNEISASLKDLEKIRELTGLDFQGVICSGNYSLPLYNENLLNEDDGLNYYINKWARAIPASQQLFDKMGFKLYGRLPQNQGEIVITKYNYEQFAIAGVVDSENNRVLPEDVGDIEDFLKKEISLNTQLRLSNGFDGKCVVVGILDTFADADGKIANLQPSKDSFYQNRSMNLYFGYGYHSLIYIHQTLYDNYIKDYSREDTTGFGRGLGVSIGGFSGNGVATQDSLKYMDEVIWLDGKGDRKELAENEILIGVDNVSQLWPAPDNGNIYAVQIDRATKCGYNKKFFNNLITFEYMSLYDFRFKGKSIIAYCEEAERLPLDKLEIYKQYCKDNKCIFDLDDLNEGIWDIGAIYVNTNNNDMNSYDTLTESQWRCSYACYLSCEEGGYNENAVGESSGRVVAEQNANRIFLANRVERARSSMKQINETNYSVYYSGTENKDIKFDSAPQIVGVYIPKYGYPSDFIINDNLYNNSLDYDDTNFEYLLAPFTKDVKSKDIAMNVAKIHYSNNSKRGLSGTNPIYVQLSVYSNPFKVLLPFIQIAGIVVGLFSVLLLGNYIALSISSKKKEIGILRAVGAKKSDIFAIFINEGVIIASIILVLALIVVAVLCIGFNTLLPSAFGIKLNLFNFSIRQIAVLLAVGFGTTALASAIPLYKLSKKKPVDSIQDR